MSTPHEECLLAAQRLHHISMLYGGFLAELARGHSVGLLPVGTPGLSQCRDFIDMILFSRAEISALTSLLVKMGGFHSRGISAPSDRGI